MPRLTKTQGEELLAYTKQKQRLLQEVRTSERLEQLATQAKLRKKLIKAQGEELLAQVKQRQRLLQEARTSKRLEQLDIEACDCLGRQLQFEYLELSGELECPETDTRRQYTLVTSEDENDLEQDQKQEPEVGSCSVNKYIELESPD